MELNRIVIEVLECPLELLESLWNILGVLLKASPAVSSNSQKSHTSDVLSSHHRPAISSRFVIYSIQIRASGAPQAAAGLYYKNNGLEEAKARVIISHTLCSGPLLSSSYRVFDTSLLVSK